MAGTVRRKGVQRTNFGLGGLRACRAARAGALLGCCALLLQFLIPLVHSPRLPLGLEGVSGLAALCVVAAEKTAAPAPGDSAPAKPATDKTLPLCPICLGLQLAGTFIPPAPILLPILPASAHRHFVPREQFAAGSAAWIAAQPRGPPAAS